MYRIAEPGEFTFKRDSAGVETVEHQGLIFATMQQLNQNAALPGDVAAAIDKARDAGFWVSGRPAPSMSPVSVTVQV